VNMSRDWSRVLVTVPLPRESDIEKEIIRIDRVCAEMARDPKFAEMLIEVPSVQGVDNLGESDVEVRVAGRSLPVQQWKVERETAPPYCCRTSQHVCGNQGVAEG